MIIVDPHQVAWPVTVDDRLAEESVRFDIGLPVLRVEFQLRGKIMKYRPKRLVCVTFVESCRYIPRQFDCETMFRFGPLRQNRTPLLTVLRPAISGPADPLSTRLAEKRI